ncbi:MAG: HD domain-containing protein [Acidimicrobiales bacterium]
MADPPPKMHFRHMDEGTDADFMVLAEVHKATVEHLPDLLLDMLGRLKGDEAYPIDRMAHSLQAATRAQRDGRDEEYVVCALLHDVAESIGPFNHGEIAAAILKPFISVENYWMLAHHQVFQVYFFGQHLGLDPNERDRFVTSPFYDRTVDFTALYDEVSFDPEYDNEPLSTFEPMVRRVLARDWTPPT